MRLGAHLRELSTQRLGLVLSGLLAVGVAILSVYQVGVLPPSLHPRAVEIGAASTEVLVDDPYSTISDLRANTVDLSSMTTRADLLGNVMASYPVRTYIGRIVGVDPARIDVTAPITADVPRVTLEPGSGAAATEILASADHYKLEIQADPTVPILHIYAQAPSKAAAIHLAAASVQGLRSYLQDLAQRRGIPSAQQVRLQQLGNPSGGVINKGVAVQIALLAFVGAFIVSCGVVLLLARVRRGWALAQVAGPTAS